MSNLCDFTSDTSDYQYLQVLLSLNDSELIQITSDVIPEIDAPKLRQIIRNKIPGKFLIQCQIFHIIWNIFPPILFLLGTLGNTTAFCVLVQRKLIRVSTYYYLAVLACFDQLILLIGLLRRWIDKVGGISSENKWLIWCQTFQFIGVSTSFMSVWLIVVVTVERLIVIKLPLQVNSYVSIKKTKLIIVCLFVVAVTISSHFFKTVGLVNINESLTKSKRIGTSSNNSSLICDFKHDYLIFAKFWTFVDAILYSCLPLLLMVIINIVIGHGIYRADRIRGEMMLINNNKMGPSKTGISNPSKPNTNRFTTHGSGQGSSPFPNRETRQLTIMLMVVSCTFLITTTPLVLRKFHIKLTDYSDVDVGFSTKLELMDTIFEMLMYTNHAINFLLYCASGKKFRYHVKKFFRRCYCRKSQETNTQYNRITTIPQEQSTI